MAGYQSNYGSGGGSAGGAGGGGGGRMPGNYNDDGMAYGDRVPGARRQKVLGYLRAANELRQSYQNSFSARYGGDDDGSPLGGFPDMDVVRSGDEEMLLFPSYARKHIKRNEGGGTGSERDGQTNSQNDSRGDTNDADYWRREWEKHEDKNAIVDVDVRGWIYTPQKGPLTRRNRLLLAVARKLSGIPAPDQNSGGAQDSGQSHGFRASIHDSMMSQEEEAAAREAEIIARHGQKEMEAAAKGDYRIDARRDSPSTSRSTSPSPSIQSVDRGSLSKRASWNPQTSEMSREELTRANDQLMTRLRPFMTLPLANAPITVFFFNDQKSQSKSVTTDESGHFNLRAALDFVPSKVRVLASEELSAVEDVIVTESTGISLVSDIDDTIKHSAIAGGAREIFKNTFIRELDDLTIQGVKEWYRHMAEMGVKMHYVSNSPWQLYPLLKSYFKMASLPPGSMHLKQYSGMLQGIFEPAAERKKGSLERIMHDFPERKFILVGDSGEADLEVYTDIVLANPGRVLGVFIRDVTTSDQPQPSNDATSGSQDRADRPRLPSRPKTVTAAQPTEENLIDFDDKPEVEEPKRSQPTSSYSGDLEQLRTSNQPPNKPAKPSNLRSFSTTPAQSQSEVPKDRSSSSTTSDSKRGPPPPPRPRRSGRTEDTSSSEERPVPRTQSSSPQIPRDKPELPHRTASSQTQNSTYSDYSYREDEGYLASARRQLATAYNSLPQVRSSSPDVGPGGSTRRGLSSYPAAAARWATGAVYGDPAAGGDGGAIGATYNKKEEMWKRRWARSEEIMNRDGVVLKTWRVGSDVMDECVRLVEQAQAQSRK